MPAVDAAPAQVFRNARRFDAIGQANVETWGEITADLGACGGTNECFTLTTPGGDIEFRGDTTIGFATGDCVHWVGPLGVFDGTAQLDLSNYNWYEWY